MFDPVEQLTSLSTLGGRLLFYPSCGNLAGSLFEMDYDVFVLADKQPRTISSKEQFWQKLFENSTVRIERVPPHHPRLIVFRILAAEEEIGEQADKSSNTILVNDDPSLAATSMSKWGFLFFEDNNVVLETIKKSGAKINCFAGVRDGCCEGGNYECVNSAPFLRNVLELLPPAGMEYYTDHSPILEPIEVSSNSYDWFVPPPYQEMVVGSAHFQLEYVDIRGLQGQQPSWVKMVRMPPGQTHPFTAHWHHKIFLYAVHPSDGRVLRWRRADATGKPELLVTFEHANIADHLHELDGALLTVRGQHLCKKLLSIEQLPVAVEAANSMLQWHSGKSTEYLLHVSAQNGWRVVGTTAYGHGAHMEMLQVLRDWDKETPQHIRIFHLDASDFSDIAAAL